MKAKITFKFLFDIFLIFIIAILMLYNQLFIYGLQMGKGELHIVCNTRTIEECMKDAEFPDSLKNKLLLIQEIRHYAIDSLGLNNSPNYTTIYDQRNKPAIWVLSACEPFYLRIKVWKFPLLGSVPYKGFFKKEEAQQEQSNLTAEGYDTKMGTTSGWSTLGWFKDPILSNMLLQNEGNLAELIIHELTHSTIFIKDNVQHNENLANFVGEMGAKKFLIYKFGKNSKEYCNYLNQQKDELMYSNYMLNSVKKLDSLYKSFGTRLNFNEKKMKKETLILSIVDGVRDLKLSDKYRYFKVSKRAITCKNAFFMEFVRYDAQHNYFESEMNKDDGGDITTFIKQQKTKSYSIPGG